PGAVPISNFAERERRRRSVLPLRHRQALQQLFQNSRTHFSVTPNPKVNPATQVHCNSEAFKMLYTALGLRDMAIFPPPPITSSSAVILPSTYDVFPGLPCNWKNAWYPVGGRAQPVPVPLELQLWKYRFPDRTKPPPPCMLA